jgi:asparagine synthase (glutamine-hydrolysing)
VSGIAGILAADASPVDQALLWSMTRALATHGPDAQRIYTSGPVGLGHAQLITTPEQATESQPASLDNGCWITADCRIDARPDLIGALRAAGQAPRPDAPDALLILHAYAAWGDDCLDHLIGDFAFALWDGPRRRLVCARDHFGVKPFFYAETPTAFVFSTSLNAVRRHPDVGAAPDEAAIVDFLVFGFPLDTDRTSFSAIRRLPPGQTLCATGSTVTTRRYWTIAADPDPRPPRRHREVIEEFRALLDAATADRLRTREVSILMSGGLDSPAVAATAHRILRADGAPFALRAHTIVFDRLVADPEREYARCAAEAIGIPIDHHAFDDFGFPPPEPEPRGYPPEPRLLFDRARTIAVHRFPARHARVVLRADGADSLFIATADAPARWLDDGQYWRLAKEYLWLAWTRRQMPYFGIRTLVRRAMGRADAVGAQPFPVWLAPDLADRLQLHERWRAESAREANPPALDLAHPYWPAFFESIDPASMQLPAEIRYPFFDLRLVRWALGLPLVPWAMEKSLLRIAMRGALPPTILRRRKSPLRGNPWASLLPPAASSWWVPYLTPTQELSRFVDVPAATDALRRVLARGTRAGGEELRSALRPLSLSIWLRQTAS